jgi:hypothetical protein
MQHLEEFADDFFFFNCKQCIFEPLYEHQLINHVKRKHNIKTNFKKKSEKSNESVATKKIKVST